MKLKFLFFFLALLLTAVWTILLVLTLKERGALFYIGEGVITFSLVFLVYFYRKVVKPLDIIGNGMELLREQDFSSRLTPVGQKEADRIVLVFNRMMEQLKDERLRLLFVFWIILRQRKSEADCCASWLPLWPKK